MIRVGGYGVCGCCEDGKMGRRVHLKFQNNLVLPVTRVRLVFRLRVHTAYRRKKAKPELQTRVWVLPLHARNTAVSSNASPQTAPHAACALLYRMKRYGFVFLSPVGHIRQRLRCQKKYVDSISPARHSHCRPASLKPLAIR